MHFHVLMFVCAGKAGFLEELKDASEDEIETMVTAIDVVRAGSGCGSGLQRACAWHVRGMCMVSAWYVRGMRVACAWHLHGCTRRARVCECRCIHVCIHVL